MCYYVASLLLSPRDENIAFRSAREVVGLSNSHKRKLILQKPQWPIISRWQCVVKLAFASVKNRMRKLHPRNHKDSYAITGSLIAGSSRRVTPCQVLHEDMAVRNKQRNRNTVAFEKTL